MTLPPCKYEKCDEQAHDGAEFCIFHDKSYLKGFANYDKNKDEVAAKFQAKLDEYVSSKRPLNFNGCCLPHVSIGLHEFSESIDFSGATFYGYANFSSATFSEGAHFNDVTFTKDANFNHTTFSKGAYFYRATFSEAPTFDDVIFSEGADFGAATFSERPCFAGTTFSGRADFNNAAFSGGVDFGRDDFSEADFFNATFTEGGVFGDATFTKEADFNHATFSERADFDGATFIKGANFVGTKFHNANFTQTKFLNEVRFSGSEFKGEVLFKYTIFEQPAKTMFDVYDLSKVSFAGTDISKVTFTDKVKWGGKDHLKIIEEEWIETGSKKISIYHNISNYGESISRPTIIGVITVALSTLFWVMQSKPTLEPHFFINGNLHHSTSNFIYLNQAGNLTQLAAAFQRSIGDFLPVLSLPSDIKVGIIDYITKIVGGALTFGLLIIAFRRKFERKYTR